MDPREAEAMDPQQRFLLEVVYEAIESAGYPLNSLAGSDTSVFVGVMSGDYHDLQLRDVNSLPQHMATGTARSILSNRVSYFFDWKGPSMTIDTACSSSLVAVHQAIATLRQGSQIAIVAGANLILGPEAYIFESKLRMLSPTGRSRMWDASADGYARGEGFAAIMLKPLSKAIQDGDTIDCVIRSSGVNQDGYGPTGLTAPIAAAQVALIRKTYADAGLDPNQTSDRCQYFEAHGTGTAAGDPVEAEAISRAFFSSTEKRSTEQRMYVGSIKTVIGHLEGTAGLAGLLKASLMVQNGLIPPNMLFKTLNPAITPFYTNLEVPTVATPWPNLPENAPRRVSVNSFGFGGTNAHVIVENYPAQLVKKRSETLQDTLKSSDPVAPILPVILSAKTGSALARTLRSVHAYLEAHPKTSCIDLAWTSIFHRTLFAYRHSFSVVTTEALKDCLLSTAAELETSETRIRSISSAANVQPRILGVLTGQGAQWPTMGSSLLRHCPTFAESIRHMDSALAELPDKPAWTLKDAMQVEETTSQIHSAQVSQPVCTAVQIALIDLLKSIGIIFSAVIGHSSGEIAAAYAAGVITAKEAIYIAYYRGRYSYLATGFDDANGAMMATGLSFAQATVFCAQDQWAGRLVVAADNGPSSTTMSGDRDAILEADDALRNEGVFTRMLKVDKAYHSHHMYPCAKPYLGSLERCHIHPQLPNCTWISTVHVHQVLDEEDIAAMHGPYWVQNMENPVLFTQSLELVLRTQAPFDVAVEIGPHPSLAGPSKQTMKATLSDPIPYHGTLNRNESDIVAISSTLGFLMTHLASPNVDFRHYQHLFPSVSAPRFLKDFPTYCWDHGREFWKESRTSERFRSRYTGIHDLLGSRLPDDDEDVMRWSNVLHAQELPWASGHCFQNQILFPAAGYILMAVEASTLMVAGRHIQALTLLDLQILKAITLDESSTGIATIFTITKGGPQDLHADCLRADFTLYAATQQGSVEMIKHFSGSVLVYLAHSGPPGFSQREKVPDYMIDVGVRQFYESMSSVGLDYTGAFQGIISMRRSNLRSTTEVSHEEYFSNESALLIHPALVDSCLQGLLAAFAAPGDGSLWTAYLPTSVHRAHFNLDCFTPTNRSTSFVDSYVTESSASSLVGDVEVFNAQGCLQLQLEGLTCTAIEKPSPLTDRKLFARTAWKCEPFNSMESNALPPQKVTWVQQLAEVCERYSYLYLKNLRLQIHKEEEESLKWHLKRLFAFVDHILPLLEEGRCLTYDPEWTNDTEEILDTLSNPMRDEVDIQIVRAIGSSLVDICRGKKEPLEILQQNDMLSRQYINGLGFSACNEHVSAIANQIVHRYPNMRILEIGAGTGATTRAMAKAMGSHYHEYYYTDVSAGFFERAKTILNSDKVTYTILNIEDDPTTQGFEQNSFDLIVASNVLHATRYLKKTMRYVRKLLKPGGFLLLMEITGGWLRNRLPVSCLPGWWLGADDDRPHGATRTEEQWEELLLDAGFSGLDRVERDAVAGMPHSMSTILSQATDDLVQTIRRPLDFPEMIEPPSRLIILGGKSLRVSSIAQDIKLHLKNWHPNIDIIKSPDEIEVVECEC
ncbi:Type I Iterative PKS [Paraconiothyrium brasiliense]|uniref:Type I Iterative PKS n=1 Tax=Paraconiothyrium brasiliense TaxID=300254 RepID=A0ABR3S2F7_9PLEO